MKHPKTISELLALPELVDERLGIKTRGYLFHGSTNGTIDLLEPRQAFHKNKPDGAPAVCASDDPYRSIFISLFNAVHLEDPSNEGSGWSRDGNQPTAYKATRNVIDVAQTATGHLYLLNPDDFEWMELSDPDHGKKRELRSLSPVKPIHKIEVSIADFPYQVEPLDLNNL